MNITSNKHIKAPSRGSAAGPIVSFSIPARVLICDDQQLIRMRVRQILEQLPTFQVVGVAVDGRSAVSMALQLKPDIILMDVSMPEDGIQATAQIAAQAPGIRILGYSSDLTEETAKKMLTAGAHGYLSKTGDAAELVGALIRVLAGERFVSIKKDRGPSGPRRD